jgi:hypothetical protein
MSDTIDGSTNRDPEGTHDDQSALQRELKREETEGGGAIGDMSANRNLSGSSTWETLPVPGGGEREVRREIAANADDAAEESRHHVQDEIADRLRRRGVRLAGNETGEELVDVLDAVERFEAVVEASGGDLMMDEPVRAASPIQPDDRAFVLPTRESGESVAAFVERIENAIAGATKHKRNRGE